ncbi:MAG: glycosyltransferase [Clostridium sp.]|nr:glycosyltransferase [Clostridium sp.]
MKKKKLLFIINSFVIGGAEKSLVSLLDLIDYEKYDVDVLTINNGGEFKQFINSNVRFLPIPKFVEYCNQPVYKQILNWKFFITRLALSKALRDNNKSISKKHDTQVYWQACEKAFDTLPDEYDLAIGWGQGVPVKFVASKVNAVKKAVWINADYEAVGHRKEDDLENFEKVDYIVSVSDTQNENMIKLFPMYREKCRTIYDINNSMLIEKMADGKKVLEDYDGLKIVTVGRLNPLKGQDMAVDAAKILKDNGVKYKWYAVGDGPARAQLEKQIKELGLENDFILLGAKANPYPYMKACDIYVQTSRFEGFCLTLAEARILNKPCITTAFECVYNQMIQEKNGLVVGISAQSIADGIERMISDDDLRNDIIAYLKTEKKGNVEEIEKFYNLIEE